MRTEVILERLLQRSFFKTERGLEWCWGYEQNFKDCDPITHDLLIEFIEENKIELKK